MVGNRFDEEIENLFSIDSSGNLVLPSGLSIVCASPTSLIGYSTGAGGTVGQLTNKTTGVTLNKVCGIIVMDNAALGAGAEAAFTVTNSAVLATDVIVLSLVTGGTANSYHLCVSAVTAGSFDITVSNRTAGALGEALVINFAVIKGIDS